VGTWNTAKTRPHSRPAHRGCEVRGCITGHLEKGGQFNVEQTELSPNQWEVAVMEVDVKGKALFFKTIAVQEKEYRSDFHRVPEGLTLAEAADMLTK